MSEEEQKNQPIETKPKKHSKKKMILFIIFFVCLTVLIVVLMLNIGDLSLMSKTFNEVIKGDHWGWLVAAVGCGLLYFALYPSPLLSLAKDLKIKAKKKDIWLVGNSEHFYNGVTPSSVGGQPFQAYALTSCNVSGADSTGLILMNYINCVLCSVLYGFISLIYYPRYVEGLKTIQQGLDLSSLQWIAVLGIILNALNLAFFSVLGFSKRARNAIVAVVRFFCKWKWLGKRLNKLMPAFETYLDNTQKAAKEVMSHPWDFVKAVIMRMLILAVLYSAPFFLLLSVGKQLTFADYPVVMLGTAFATVCVAWFPTPGGVGAGELVAAVVIASVGAISYSQGQAVSLLWRLIGFYAILIFSLITSIIFEARVSKNLTQQTKEITPPKNKEDENASA